MYKFLSQTYSNKFAVPSLPPPETKKNASHKITGASGGLGLAAAVHFVNLGASSVTITARSKAKGEAARAVIEAQTGTRGKDIVDVMELQMDTLASVREFADRLTGEKGRKKPDYVLLNAGVLNRAWREGKGGFEESIQINVLSTALLGLLLLPWLREGFGERRLVFVTSGTHRSVAIDGWPREDVLGYLSRKENWPKEGIYGTNKLLEQYVVNEIAKLVAVGSEGKAKVIVNPMCPGMAKSDLGRQYNTGALMSFSVDMFMNLFAKSTEAGARSLVLAAMAKPEENGKYITHYQSDADYRIAAEKSVFSPDAQQMQAEVWKEVLTVLEKQVPEVKKIAGV